MATSGNKSDYPWIRAWGKMMDSRDWYIKDQVDRARQDGAPQTAYAKVRVNPAAFDGEEVWKTVDQITHPQTRASLGLPPLEADAT